MCNVLQQSDDVNEIDNKAQQLLSVVERMEQAARRGIELNKDREPSIPPEKTISVEQCEWTLRDCRFFRDLIADVFGLPKQLVS